MEMPEGILLAHMELGKDKKNTNITLAVTVTLTTF